MLAVLFAVPSSWPLMELSPNSFLVHLFLEELVPNSLLDAVLDNLCRLSFLGRIRCLSRLLVVVPAPGLLAKLDGINGITVCLLNQVISAFGILVLAVGLFGCTSACADRF